MSAYGTYKTEFEDADILCEALRAMGLSEVFKHQTAVNLQDYIGQTRPDTAEIVIPRRAVGQSSNDIGFKRGDDGKYKAIISEFDSRTGAYDATWNAKLANTYGEKLAMRTATRAGLRFVGKKTDAKGRVQLKFISNK